MEKNNLINAEVLTGKKTDSLLFKFAIVFAVFTVVTLLCTGVATYTYQENIFQQQVSDNVNGLEGYLQSLMQVEDKCFAGYQAYITTHYDEVLVPLDFDGNYLPAKDKFVDLMDERYPGKTPGVDISFAEMDEDVQNAFAVYLQEYWIFTFESASRAFNLDYTYYITPTGEQDHMYYVIDALRDERVVDGKSYIQLCLDITQDRNVYPVMWDTWDQGKIQPVYEDIDNQYGRDYGYYTPLYINGEKLGLIAADVEVNLVRREILGNTVKLLLLMAGIFLVGGIATLFFIDHKYIRKLENLVESIKQYAKSKDPEIVDFIDHDVKTKDEISALANQTAAMILELDSYMKDLMSTTRELTQTKQHADELQAIANRDSLTGIRNKAAYDEELKRLEWEVVEGRGKFGMGIVNLNGLSVINEEYGKDKGNIAIKKLSRMVCEIFKHSPVFRTGVDEFGIILRNADFELAEELEQRFKLEINAIHRDESLPPWERISAAIGVSLCDPVTDYTVSAVNKRAQEKMGKNKKEMKEADK